MFGANIGTTITGWLVAIVGFKLQMGTLALPFVLVGVLMNLFLRRHWAALGFAIAGFGLIFVGIDLIQQGMSGLQGIVTPASFPGDTRGGRFLLVLIGVALTLVTQSSSAGVATALVAIHAGTINFPQAAALVIGMDVGTSATAALATIGGSTDVRRTGIAHVIYNLLTATLAFLLVTPYAEACQAIAPDWFRGSPEIALVGFHTLFNTIGVIVVLPFTRAFARMMIWLIPEQPVKYTQRLDRSLYASPIVALDAVRATLRELAQVVLQQLILMLERGPSLEIDTRLDDANEALKRTRDYVTLVQASTLPESLYPGKMSAIHAIDHLRRLIDRCQKPKRAERARTEPELVQLGQLLLDDARQAQAAIADTSGTSTPRIPADPSPHDVWLNFDARSEQNRNKLIASAAAGQLDAHTAIRKLDALRWIRRVSYHIWRIMHHLSGENRDNATVSATPPAIDLTDEPAD